MNKSFLCSPADRLLLPVLIVMIASICLRAQTDSLDSLVDTLAGRQEYEFQQAVEEEAVGDIQTLRQFIIDSMTLVYDEKLMEQKDSLVTLLNTQITDILNQNSMEITKYRKTIRALQDSLKARQTTTSAIVATGEPQFDPESEQKYFEYEKFVKRQEKKTRSGFLILTTDIEDIHPFQVNQLEQYLDTYFPAARCDSIQDFLTQIYIRKQDWANAERSIIKFIFLYPESPLAEEIKTIRAGIFQTEKTYKSYTDFLMNVVASTPAYPDVETRYFRFVELLKDFPDPAVKAMFPNEAQTYLQLYPFSEYAPQICLWLAQYYAENLRPQSAFITYHRLMIFYPNSPEMAVALYQSARLQEKEFEEYDQAIETLYRFINLFPDDTLAVYAHHRIAQIADIKKQNWEQATTEYQIAGDLFMEAGKDHLSTDALMRKAVILADQMNLIQDAIATYLSVDDRFPGSPDAHQAIMAAGDLYARHKQYESAIAEYMKLYDKYPAAENIVNALDKAADIYSSKLNDHDKTVETLNLIVTNYPDSKSAKKAEKQLKKIEKSK
ncbi:MAG: tetratricopeptide repeat protein [Fidelibacterota bacterium]